MHKPRKAIPYETVSINRHSGRIDGPGSGIAVPTKNAGGAPILQYRKRGGEGLLHFTLRPKHYASSSGNSVEALNQPAESTAQLMPPKHSHRIHFAKVTDSMNQVQSPAISFDALDDKSVAASPHGDIVLKLKRSLTSLLAASQFRRSRDFLNPSPRRVPSTEKVQAHERSLRPFEECLQKARWRREMRKYEARVKWPPHLVHTPDLLGS